MRLLRYDMHALSGAYALDAVDGTEREKFEQHLTRCTSCQNEIGGLQETATRFALAVTAPPPARLKARVMAAAARTRQFPPAPGVPSPPEPGTGWLRRLAIPLVAASVVVAVALAVLLGISRSQLGSVSTRQREIAAVLTAPGTRIVHGRTTLGGAATVVVARNPHRLVFIGAGLPGLADSRVYQLWFIGPAGNASSVGLLAREASGSTVPVLASGWVTGDRVGLTVEPAGGTTKPTTAPIVVISLPF
jgi:anti-sigma-K factor RskA